MRMQKLIIFCYKENLLIKKRKETTNSAWSVRAFLAGLAYVKCKINLAYRPKKSQQWGGQMGKGQIFFDI